MREKGAETRRFLVPVALRMGDRPAGAVIGVRGADMLPRMGVERRDGIVGGGAMLDRIGVARVKSNGISLLLFFGGELEVAGSTFSLSKSDEMEGSKERLLEIKIDFDDGERLVLPSSEDLPAGCGIAPMGSVSTLCRRVRCTGRRHTILAILRAGQMLQTRVVQRCEWHSSQRDVTGHGSMRAGRGHASSARVARRCRVGSCTSSSSQRRRPASARCSNN